MAKAPAQAAVLVSGGLDSDALLAQWAGRYRSVLPIYIRQGLAWEKVELYWLRLFLRALPFRSVQPLLCLEVPMQDAYGGHWSLGSGKVPGARSADRAVFLPGRNLTLTVKAGVVCALRRIPLLAVGSLDHNPFPDASPGFFRLWSRAMSRGLGRPLRIVAPFRSKSKADVIRESREFPLDLSFSCLAPQGRRHCGRCNKCAERRKAFRQAGVPDRTPYAG